MTAARTLVGKYLCDLDSRAMPRYTFGEAARYLGLPESTLRAWFLGTTWGSQPHLRQFKPFLTPASRDLLSFFDIASVHVLMAFKRQGVPPDGIRTIVESLQLERPNARYPLLGTDFFLFGKAVIIKTVGQLLNLSKHRQLGLKNVMNKFLSRMEFDSEQMPLRFKPLLGSSKRLREDGRIVIDPHLSAGRPVLRGTGVPAEVISMRKKSGESYALLARDYRVSIGEIKEAVRYFEPAWAA
jgi:uncharacterized protein (DUF433 family)